MNQDESAVEGVAPAIPTIPTIPVIAIDGPSGSGKGTLARAVADKLGWHLLDSGALYRIVGVMCLRRGVDFEDEAQVAALAAELSISFDEGQVSVAGLDLTDEIRTEDAGVNASKVAHLPAVRDAVFALQRLHCCLSVRK